MVTWALVGGLVLLTWWVIGLVSFIHWDTSNSRDFRWILKMTLLGPFCFGVGWVVHSELATRHGALVEGQATHVTPTGGGYGESLVVDRGGATAG